MGRGSSGARSDGGATVNALTSSIDAQNLTKDQIDRINMQRYDVFSGALRYAKENSQVEEPKLTETQRKLYFKMRYDDDYTGLDNASKKTLESVRKQAEYDYDKAQRKLAKGDYDVRDDYVRRSRDGVKIKAGTFVEDYTRRQKAAKIINETTDALERKDVKAGRRSITSDAYERAKKKRQRDLDNWFFGKRR